MAARRIAQLIPSRARAITLEQSGVRPIPYARVRKLAGRNRVGALALLVAIAFSITAVWWLA